MNNSESREAEFNTLKESLNLTKTELQKFVKSVHEDFINTHILDHNQKMIKSSESQKDSVNSLSETFVDSINNLKEVLDNLEIKNGKSNFEHSNLLANMVIVRYLIIRLYG